MKKGMLQRAIFCSLLALVGTPLAACESSDGEAKRSAGVVFCNQGEQALLADITACLGSVKTNLISCQDTDSKTDVIISQIDQLTENLSVVDASLCSKLDDLVTQLDNLNRTRTESEDELGLRAGGVVFCNQGERAQIDQVSSCCAAIKASLGSPGAGEPNLHSKANIIESLIEEIAESTGNINTEILESKIDVISEEVSISDAAICTKLVTIQSEIDINTSVVEDIDSKVDILCSKILVVDSQTDSVESLLDVIESKVDVNTSISDLVQSEVEIIDSNVDILCTKILRVESKVDDVNLDLSIDNALICTKLNRIDSKIDVIDIDLSLTDESLCSKLIVIDSKVDVIDSITDDLHDTACIGRYIIRQSDLNPLTGYVITAPGLYSIGEDLTWSSPGAAISISPVGIDGVDIDFHCNALVLTNAGVGSAMVGINIPASSGQVSIRNGRLQSITGNMAPDTTLILKTGDTTESLITIENMTFISDAQTNSSLHRHIVASACNDIHIFDCTFFQGTRAIETSACNRIDIFNCQFNRVFDQAVFNLVDFNFAISNCDFQLCGEDINSISSQHISINGCTHLQSGRIDGYNSVSFNTCNDVVVKNCSNQGAGTGTGATVVEAYATIASQCVMYLNNSVNGGVRDGILLDANCSRCKVIDNSVDCMGTAVPAAGVGIFDVSGTNLVLGNCVANSVVANYSGVPLALIAAGTAAISTAANRWINVSN